MRRTHPLSASLFSSYMMDGSNSKSQTTTTTSSSHMSSLLLSYLLSSSPSSSSSSSSAAHNIAGPMPFSAPSLSRTQSIEDGFVPILEGLDGYDCDSEGVEVLKEPMKTTASRGSKRSRAAEVHNLSEKRRRSRINEKMRALQSLIPNCNKTDKASILDEAIDYLKRLQLQVQQLLAMKNSLNLQTIYLPTGPQPPVSSQECLGSNAGNEPVMNMGILMLPVTQDSMAQSSFDLPNRYTSSLQNLVPGVSNMPSQPHCRSSHLSVAAEILFHTNT